MKYIVTINQNNYEVEVEQGEAKIVTTNETAPTPLAAQTLTTPPAQTQPISATPTPEVAKAVRGEEITAPMPGIILQIKKNSGEQVKTGETIMILEAMKMENEIIAARDGVIIQITIAVGATVNTGDVLAVMQ